MKGPTTKIETLQDFLIVPYNKDKQTISDELFHYFWKKLCDEGLDQKVFYAGYIKDPYQFTMLMKYSVLPFMVIDPELGEPIAMAWLTDIIDKRAFAHFAILKEAWHHSDKIGLAMLQLWFSMGLNLVLGLTPSKYRMVLKFLERIGMTILGEIPMAVKINDAFEAATISYKVKEG